MWYTMPSSSLGISVLIMILTLVVLLVKCKKGLKLPPGPRGLPIVGFLPFLSATEPHLQLDKMRKKYGNIFGMYMGSKYFLILCDIQSTREAFSRDDYTLKPEGRFQVLKDFTTIGSANGQQWVDHRKLAIRTIRDLCLNSQSFQEEVTKQVKIALELLDKRRSENVEGEVNLREATSNAIVAMICSIICGKSYPPEHEVTSIIHKFMKAFLEFGTAFSIDTYFPWLKPLTYCIVPTKTSMRKAFKEMENFFWSEIEYHEKNPVDEPTDFLYYYLAKRTDPKMETRFKRSHMNGVAQGLVFAASDTTRSVVEWFILCMAKFHHFQDKVYQEICDHLGSSGLPDYDQRDKTPWTEACILETLRYRTLAPLYPIHGSPKKVTSFRGYDIPAETVIVSNLWLIHNDPRNWENPDEFDPRRFLTADGKVGEIPECFVPFGTGKRMCIGSKLALKEIYFLGLCFLQRFQVLPPKGGVNMDGRMTTGWEAVSPTVRLIPRD